MDGGILPRGSTSDKENITFRLSNHLVKRLKSAASDERLTTNAMVSRILDDYFEWDKNAAKAGWMVVPKYAMKKIEGDISDKKLRVIAREMSDYALDMMMMMTGEHNLESFLTIIHNSAKRSGFNVNIMFNPEKKIIIQHDMGRNWSIMNSVYYENVLNELGYRHEIKFTPSSLIIRIK